MKIFGWAADDYSGCWWYRIKLPLDALRDLGHDTAYDRRLPPEWWMQPDVVIGQRIALPEATERWRRLHNTPGRPLMVYETDDDLLNIDHTNPQAHKFFGRTDIQDNVRECIRLADLVTVSTAPLADIITPINPHVVVLPNYIPTRLLDVGRVPEPTDGDPLVIGWAGSSTHVVDFDEVADALVRFVLRHPNVHYHSKGLLLNGKPAVWNSLKRIVDADQVRIAGWFPLPHYYEALTFNIGIAPLRPSLFNRSKSPIKAMEYAARGCTTVASNTGPYADYIRHGETGLLADHHHQWVRHFRDLTQDPDLRRGIASHARAHVARLTIERHAHEWADAFQHALTGRTTTC